MSDAQQAGDDVPAKWRTTFGSLLKLALILAVVVGGGYRLLVLYPDLAFFISAIGVIVTGFVLISFIRTTAPLETAPTTAGGTPLAEDGAPVPAPLLRLRALEPRKFVSMMVDLFEELGFDVAEGPVPVAEGAEYFVAVNPEPIKGGRFVVECFSRPAANLIDSTRVLGLLGAVKAESASKGVYCTPFVFSEEATTASRTGPVDLLDGSELVKLLEKKLPDRLVER